MIVKELIIRLLGYSKDMEIGVANDVHYIDDLGNEVVGQSFNIKRIEQFGGRVNIVFHDWSKNKEN